MKTLIMPRHASSLANAGIHWAGGPTSIPLSSQGEVSAQELADNWDHPVPDLICCSTYARSAQTAAPLAKRFGLPLHTLEELREFTWWDFQWTAEEYKAKREEAAAYWVRLDPHEKAGGANAESFVEAMDRCYRFRTWVMKTPFTVGVCVSHGYFMHMFRAVMQGVDLPPREFMVYLRDTLVGNAYANLQIETYLISP
jgi:broad specificity phosphatase PhoE